jgi:probable HAF family extracellular repeat protein
MISCAARYSCEGRGRPMKLRFGVLFAFLFFVALVHAQKYTVTDLGPLNPKAINTWGQIVGDYNDHAFLRTRTGKMHDLGLLPGGTFSTAADINDLGVITGTANGPGTVVASPEWQCANLTQPFIWTESSGMKGLGTAPAEPGWPFRFPEFSCGYAFYASGINVFNEIVGYQPDPGTTYESGFLWTQASNTQLVIGNWPRSSANAISNTHQVVGERGFTLSSVGYAVSWQNGTLTTLPELVVRDGSVYWPWYPGVFGSGANDVNDLGQIVGWSDSKFIPNWDGIGEQGLFHAVLWVGGEVRDLGTLPGDTYSVALKITYFGQVIGASGNTPVWTGLPNGHSGVLSVSGRPFIWSEANGMQDLNELIPPSGWVLTSVADINVWGQIVGSGTRHGEQRGFVLTPRGSHHY